MWRRTATRFATLAAFPALSPTRALQTLSVIQLEASLPGASSRPTAMAPPISQRTCSATAVRANLPWRVHRRRSCISERQHRSSPRLSAPRSTSASDSDYTRLATSVAGIAYTTPSNNFAAPVEWARNYAVRITSRWRHRRCTSLAQFRRLPRRASRPSTSRTLRSRSFAKCQSRTAFPRRGSGRASV